MICNICKGILDDENPNHPHAIYVCSNCRKAIHAEKNNHEWWLWNGLECCKICGIVRRNDDKNSPCKGNIKIKPRDQSCS